MGPLFHFRRFLKGSRSFSNVSSSPFLKSHMATNASSSHLLMSVFGGLWYFYKNFNFHKPLPLGRKGHYHIYDTSLDNDINLVSITGQSIDNSMILSN